MTQNAAIEKLNADAVQLEAGATAWANGAQNGNDYKQNKTRANNAARCSREAEDKRALARMIESGQLPQA